MNLSSSQLMALWQLGFGVLVFLFGACIGSFLNVCIHRIPRELSVVRPRSHCPHCERLIPWYLNVPIFSYLVLRGRCAFCRARITPRYVLVEWLVAVLYLMVWLQYVYTGARPVLGLVPVDSLVRVAISWLIIGGLVLGTFVDFEHMIIPDRVTLGGIAAGLFCSVAVPALHGERAVLPALQASALGLAVGWGVLWTVARVGRLIFKKDAMGFGDVKLLGAIGAFMGWQAVVFNLIVSSFLGSLAGVSMVALRRKEMQSRIPYGPYIALAALLWLFWGPTWRDAYIQFMTPDFRL